MSFALSLARGGIGSSLVLACLLPILWSCGDEDGTGPADRVPPTVRIVQPLDGSDVLTARPLFVIEVSDQGSGVFVATIRVTIAGEDFTEPFADGFDPVTGQIRVQGEVTLDNGEKELIFEVQDRAGNRTRESSTFTVRVMPAPPPPPGPP